MATNDDKLVALDAEDNSLSVAEARHMARKHMLMKALDLIFELGVNFETPPAVRNNALQFVVNFASEAQGNGSQTVSRLSPQAAKLIAKLGLKSPGRDVHPPEEEGKRPGAGDPDDSGGKGGPGGAG